MRWVSRRIMLWIGWALIGAYATAYAAGQPQVASSGLSAGMRFQECPACPLMTVIPAGRFTMTRKSATDGRRDDDPEGTPKTRPAREVTIGSAFAIGVYPVTVQEFDVFVRDTHRPVEQGCYVQNEGTWVFDASKDWSHPGFTQSPRHPVTCVSWNDAQDYVQWLNGKSQESASKSAGMGRYRLPTWEEIEYAAAAGTTTSYYWGDQPQRDKANYGRDRCLPCGPYAQGADRWLYTSPVGSFPPNAFGLYDMAGNVWQWAQRCQPDPGSMPPKVCRSQVLHGGSWLSNPEYLRTGEYSLADVRHRNYHIGFRVLRTLS